MVNNLIKGAGEGALAPSKPDTSVWMYRGQEARLFASPADVPVDEGWLDHPHETAVEPAGNAEAPKRRGRPPKVEAAEPAGESEAD